MTNDELPQDRDDRPESEIPELLDRLTPRLSSPEPSDIRGEAARRGEVRRRTLVGAGVFVLVATLLGGLWVSNRNAVNETATNDRFVSRAVAEDSAPLEFDEWDGQPIREQLIDQTWRVGDVRGDSQGFKAQLGRVIFNADPDTWGLSHDVDTVLYTTGCAGSSYVIEWATDIDFSEEPVELVRGGGNAFRVISELPTIPVAPNVRCVGIEQRPVLIEGSNITIGQSEGSSVITMGVACAPRARCTPKGFWNIELHRTGANQPEITSVVPLPLIERPLSASVTIAECANSSTISTAGAQWLAWDLPPEWAGQVTVPVTVVIDGSALVATDANGLTAPFGRDDGGARALSCNGFNYEQPTDTVSPTTNTTAPSGTSTTIDVESLIAGAVLATEGDIDGSHGKELIWLDEDGTIHAGDLVGTADYWEVSQYWFDQQADLKAVVLDEETTAILLSIPIPDEDEDPPNLYQLFVAEGGELRNIFIQTIGVYNVTPLEFPGDGSVSYVEDDWAACLRIDAADAGIDVANRQRVVLTRGLDGTLVETSREDTAEEKDCSELAG